MFKGQRSHTHRDIDISLYDKEVNAKKYSGRFLEPIEQCNVTRKGYLTREKKELYEYILLMKYEAKLNCREHMADKGPPAPAPKAVRAKNAHQTKTKEPPQKNPPKQNLSKTTPPLELRVVVVPVVPVDQLEDQTPLYPPNQLPDIPPDQPDQPPHNPPNQPNPPVNPPNPPANPPNEPPHPPANPPNPMQPQNPPPQGPKLNWSYFKPEFSGKPEEDVVAHLLEQMTGWKLTTFQMMQRYRDSV